jgi:hypothetical protein
VKNVFAVRRYKNGGGMKRENVRSAGLLTYETFGVRSYKKPVALTVFS